MVHGNIYLLIISKGFTMNLLITGVAGFIGSILALRLLNEGHRVWGLDNLNDYYDVNLKKDRLERLKSYSGFEFKLLDLADRPGMKALFDRQIDAEGFDCVVNLAAQAGVRYSIENPASYVDSNMVGFGNILEGCRHTGVKHLVYASSSSVSLYAASKKANELMAHTYSYLYQLPTTGLRFFTVYGPWGRPDMALFLFTRAILRDEPIKVFNDGNMQRDFTYIDDIVEGVIRVMKKIPGADPDWSSNTPNPSTSCVPYKLYNIGNKQPVALMDFVRGIEMALGRKAKIDYLPMQPGDVQATWADVNDLIADIGFKPNTQLDTGIQNFVDWYRVYCG